MFRQIQIEELSGRLLLHGMPGRHEPLEKFFAAVVRHGVALCVCLTSRAEIAQNSPDYLASIQNDDPRLPELLEFPIPDFGVPSAGEREKLQLVVGRVAAAVRAGECVSVHCGAGIGRTGMFACIVLLELGYGLEDARALVLRAGSHAETEAQKAFVGEIAAGRSAP